MVSSLVHTPHLEIHLRTFPGCSSHPLESLPFLRRKAVSYMLCPPWTWFLSENVMLRFLCGSRSAFHDSSRMAMFWLKAAFPTECFWCVKDRAPSLPADAITCSASLLCKPEFVESAFLPSLVGWGSLSLGASTPTRSTVEEQKDPRKVVLPSPLLPGGVYGRTLFLKPRHAQRHLSGGNAWLWCALSRDSDPLPRTVAPSLASQACISVCLHVLHASIIATSHAPHAFFICFPATSLSY